MIDDITKSYQMLPQLFNQNNLYELKRLNDNDEVENIAIFRNSIFIGDDRLQIKKLDGTIEKYSIKKTYPKDKKDDKIDELNKKIEELEMKLNESKSNTSIIEANTTSTRQEQIDAINDKSSTTTSSKSISKSK